MTNQDKLENWARREFTREIGHLILTDSDGSLLVFGRYRIEQQPRQVQVYVNDDPVLTFSDRRSALSWCVAQKHQRLDLARRISQLDQHKRLLSDDIDTRQRLAQRSHNQHYQDVVHHKLISRQQNRATVTDQLEKCLAQAKYIQIRGFTNETARTRR